jgi:hypothetical protein
MFDDFSATSGGFTDTRICTERDDLAALADELLVARAERTLSHRQMQSYQSFMTVFSRVRRPLDQFFHDARNVEHSDTYAEVIWDGGLVMLSRIRELEGVMPAVEAAMIKNNGRLSADESEIFASYVAAAAVLTSAHEELVSS